MDNKIKEEIEEFDEYDSGLLNDFGGGHIEWWWDYIRTEVGEANERGKSQYENLLSHIKELERQLNSSESIRHAEKEILIKEIEKNKELAEGIKIIELVGHDNDCLFCARKDFQARKLIEKKKD